MLNAPTNPAGPHIMPSAHKNLGPKTSTPPSTPLNASQTSFSSSVSKAEKKPLQRAVGSLRRVFGKTSRASLASRDGDERSLIEPRHANGNAGKSHKETTLVHHGRGQELETSLQDLRRELQEKEKRMKLFVEENQTHRQEVLDMTGQIEERDDTIRRLKLEMEDEQRNQEFMGEEKERLAQAVERIQELEAQLQASLGATETRTGSITMVAEEREEISQQHRQELAKLEDALRTKGGELDSLASSLTTLENTNKLLHERVEKLDSIRSQIQVALDQAHLQAERFKRELDVQVPLSFLVLFFTIFFICISMGLTHLYDIVLALIPQPTRTYIYR